MSSPLSSTVEKLDGSLQTIYSEIDCLGASLEINNDRLLHSLADARHHAAMLRDLIRAERPQAQWTDRKGLGELIHELEMEIAARARRNQQRRNKLLALANEFDAGKVKHRVETRAAALNSLRAKAVAELRAEANHSREVKDLPGPSANDWLLWACNLREEEEKDSAILAELHEDFPVVEAFVGQMEESYWVPSAITQRPSTPNAQPAARPEQRAAAQRTESPLEGIPKNWDEETPENAGTEFYTTTHTAKYVYSLALRDSRPRNGNSSAPQPLQNAQTQTQEQSTRVVTESLLGTIAAAPHVKLCQNCGATFPAAFEHCPFDGSPLQPLAAASPPQVKGTTRQGSQKNEVHAIVPAAGQAQVQSSQPGAIGSRPIAELGKVAEPQQGGTKKTSGDAELARLKAILVEHKGAGDFQLLDNAAPPKKLVLGFASGAAVVLSLLLAVVFFSSGASLNKVKSAVVAARAQVAAGRAPVKDSEILAEVERKLASLKGSSIEATVEDGVVTLVGRTPSKWEALHAESLVAQTNGVKRVTSQVQVDGADPGNAKKSRKPRT